MATRVPPATGAMSPKSETSKISVMAAFSARFDSADFRRGGSQRGGMPLCS